MNNDLISRQVVLDAIRRISLGQTDAVKVSMMTEEYVKAIPPVNPLKPMCRDCVSRDYLLSLANKDGAYGYVSAYEIINAPSVNPQESKTGQYEKHIDHTDCIWYGNDSGCPVTCSQYRDGWNDAMDYIYKGGKGYQPYRRE